MTDLCLSRAEVVLLTRAQVEARVGFKRSAIYARIAAGTFPAPRPDPDGGHAVRWREEDIAAWIARWVVVGTVAGSEDGDEAKAA